MSVQVTCCTDAYLHYGEQRVRDFLVEKLERAGRSELLMNCCVPSTPNALEIDLTLINEHGVFLIEVKDLFGSIHADSEKWERSHGDTQPNPVAGIEFKARVVHSYLEGKRPGWDQVNVSGLVVLSNNNPITGDRRKVYWLDDKLVDALAEGKGLLRSNKIRLSHATIGDVRQALHNARPAGQTRYVAGYPILKAVERGHYVDLEASDPEFEGRKVRIKQYDIPDIRSKTQLERARQMFKRDMAALLEAGPHPHLLIPYRFYRDPGSDHLYYLVIEWVDGMTLGERIRAGTIPLPEQLSILKEVADALIHCHSQQVIHRNLTPEAIYITVDGQVKVGDFDFAKMPSVTRTLSSTGMLKIDTFYASPEVVYIVHDVDARADIYSLGAVWYDMLSGVSPLGVVEPAEIERMPLSPPAQMLLRDMLQETPDERPVSMVEVRRLLDQIPTATQTPDEAGGQ